MGDEQPDAQIEESPSAPRPVEGVATGTTGFIGPVEPGIEGDERPESAYVRSWREFTRRWAAGGALGAAVEDFFRNGGTTAWIAPVPRLEPDAVRDAITVMDPDVALVAMVADAPAPPHVVAAGADALAGRRALLLVEGPWTDPRAGIEAMSGDRESALGATGPDVAVYWPRLRRVGATGAPEVVSPLGAVAGMIARTDATRGVHRAPGGSAAVLSGTTGTTVSATPAEQDEFNRLGVNVIRTLPPLGTVVWGARTQSLDGEWRYVPVRRTFLYISESLDRGLPWVVFEPNDETLWQRVRITIGGFLLALFRDGAFAGSSPDEGFFVRCDRTTMTQSDIDRGLLVCVIGIAPLRPVEFVVFSLVLRTADAEA